MGDARRWPGQLIGLMILAVCVPLSISDPALPSATLDGSWQLAAEYAAKHGLVFGRDFIFSYGPFHYLATRLFDPATWPFVVLSLALSVVAMFWPVVRNGSVPAAIGVGLSVLLLQVQFDALTTLAMFGVFLACLQSRSLWPVILVVLCAPLVLAKLSFGLVLGPLLVMADLDRLSARRPPVLTFAFVLACLASYLAAGQPALALLAFISSTLEIVLGYGRAMQIPGSRHELALAVGLSGLSLLVAGLQALTAWRVDRRDFRPLIAVAGLGWMLFVLFKMGFVRQDPHTLIFHMAAPAALAMAYGFLDRPEFRHPRLQLVAGLIFLLVLGSSFYWRSYQLGPGPQVPVNVHADAKATLAGVVPRFNTGLNWLRGRGLDDQARARRQQQSQIARAFPPTVRGAVDAIPFDVAPLIASGLDYRPRPVVQSYSSYTPALQRRDLAYLTGPRAPETLFLSVWDIDARLPTLATGPLLPVIGQRYDTVGSDPLGVILKRRATPRPMSVRRTTTYSLPLETWVAAPSGEGRLLMARIKVNRTLAGRLVGFVYREPLMAIHLRTASGREVAYRFVPDMAQLGVAVSPLPAAWEQGAPVLLDPSWSALGERVTAIRVVTNKRAWAFGDATVSFDDIGFAPGFAGQLRGLTLLGAQLARSDANHTASFDGDEIFAHAATTMSAMLAEPLHFRGVAGLRPQPPGTAAGDGVRFLVTVTLPSGDLQTVLDTRVAARGAPVPFEVRAPAGARLEMQTLPLADTNYDWSYWGKLEALP